MPTIHPTVTRHQRWRNDRRRRTLRGRLVAMLELCLLKLSV